MVKKFEIADPKSCLNRAKEHERVFVLLERDESTPVAIQAWATDRIKRGKNKPMDPEILEALNLANAMRETFTCTGCGWKGPYIKAWPEVGAVPRCPICG